MFDAVYQLPKLSSTTVLGTLMVFRGVSTNKTAFGRRQEREPRAEDVHKDDHKTSNANKYEYLNLLFTMIIYTKLMLK